MLDLTDFHNVHFIGICGVSMKALALLCARQGMTVSGSDRADSPVLETLCKNGIYAYRGSNEEIVDKADLVVYTACIPENDPELSRARALRKTVMERKAFLSLVERLCKRTVAVAGTHGKTTTTAMLSCILKGQGVKFIGHIGGDLPGGEISLTDSGRDVFLTEACEYKRSFLALSPDIAVVLNMQFDHPDCYRDMTELAEAFSRFTQNIKEGGLLVIDYRLKDLFEPRGVKKVTFGFCAGCDYRADDVTYEGGIYSFNLYRYSRLVGRYTTHVYGKHNILNALAALAVADGLGLDIVYAGKALQEFSGVSRRFECKGMLEGGARVIVDYAHHPDEIAAAIDTARVMTRGEITVFFEPHTFSRTKSLIDEFADSFYWADEVVILPTYAARERNIEGGSAYDLYIKLKKKKTACLYMDGYAPAADYIRSRLSKKGIILLLGAGGIDEIANLLFKR